MYGTDVQLIPGKVYRALRQAQELAPGECVVARGEQVGGIELERHHWNTGEAATLLLVPRDTFFANFELAPSDVCGRVWNNTPVFDLFGLSEDIDSGWNDRKDTWGLKLGGARLVCEVLATGETRTLEGVTDRGRPWQLKWTLEDPRSEPLPAPPADQLLWFFPGGEDWTVFRMSCRELIHGFNRELRFLLSLPDQPHRGELNALVVLLDQATLRVGL